MRPRIGLTRGMSAQQHCCEALRAAGAVTTELRAGTPIGEMATRRPERVLEALDGLLLAGGGDLDPHLYGEEFVHDTVAIDPERDAMEIGLCQAALTAGIPLLGICRGIQVINVVAGGTLWQDIAAFCPGSLGHAEPAGRRVRTRRLHTVRFAADSLACRLHGEAILAVNSLHHQAVRTAAITLRATAWAADGVVEAVEGVGRPVLGVQWHPEELWEGEAGHAVVFAWLITEAAHRALARKH